MACKCASRCSRGRRTTGGPGAPGLRGRLRPRAGRDAAAAAVGSSRTRWLGAGGARAAELAGALVAHLAPSSATNDRGCAHGSASRVDLGAGVATRQSPLGWSSFRSKDGFDEWASFVGSAAAATGPALLSSRALTDDGNPPPAVALDALTGGGARHHLVERPGRRGARQRPAGSRSSMPPRVAFVRRPVAQREHRAGRASA